MEFSRFLKHTRILKPSKACAKQYAGNNFKINDQYNRHYQTVYNYKR
jgi:hypothetical protein